ncbi:SURF1 family protein [Acidipropionibacterium virtanenii]|uniref:SURF1-like protein n=1 Tax=Acidipropionibacterium virtanenii TaxID=2057246 RepID=A0A344UT31_9ACTN|nr:SURF1 family protein [Acidipropionibacterium virtanenii]AXE38429.1 putative SURF1-like protein [Acidipropionibacterium virtanenii]
MRKLWLRWIGLALFVVVLSLVMIRLGEWQIHRLDGRREANATIRAHRAQPVLDWTAVMRPGTAISGEDQWKRVRVSGSYDAGHQVQVRYRKVGDQQGSEILTPLRATDGRTVLVDRGFIGRKDDGTDPDIADIPNPPSGRVTVIGYVKGNENGKDTAVVPVDGRARLINSDSFARTAGTTYVNGYIVLVNSTPTQSGRLAPVPFPELDEGPHLSYAVQWFCFTAIAVGGLFILIRGDIKDRRKRRERAERRRTRPTPVGKPATRGGVPIDRPADSPTRTEGD